MTEAAQTADGAQRSETFRDVQKRLTRERLIDAAVAEFAEKGYAETTIGSIASRASVRRATFYLHFQDKAQVANELIARERAALEPLWDLLRELPPHPSRAQVRGWLVTSAEVFTKHKMRTSGILDAATAEPELASRRGAGKPTQLTIFVDAIRHLGWEDEDHLRLEAMLLYAQLDRTYFYWCQSRDPIDEELVIELLTETWWSAFDRAGRRASLRPGA